MAKNWWSKGGYYSSYWGRGSSVYDFENDDGSSWNWGESYRSRYKSSLDHSRSRLTEVTSYTSSYYGRTYYSSSSDIDKNREFLEKAYKTARDLVIILDFPFNISIQISRNGDELEYGHGRRLFIPTDMLDETEYSESEKINICCGCAIHQASHLKYTEYKVLKSFSDKITEGFFGSEKIEGNKSSTNKKFIISLINIIEDVRIENLLLQERPGYLEFLELAKTYQYKKFIKKEKSSSGKVTAFLNNLFRLIRYPDGLEENVIEKYSDQYKEIQDILSPLPESTKESCIAAYKIYKQLLKIFKDLKLQDDEIGEELGIILGSFLEGFCDCVDGVDIEYSGAIPERLISDMINDDKNDIISKLVVGSAEKTENDTYFEKIRGDKERYDSLVRSVTPYIPAIKKIIMNTNKNYVFNIPSQRFGTLDTSKLAEAYQGVETVYLREGEVTTNRSTICILIDESGSMGGKKMELARKSAVLLNEAFKNSSGIDLYVYGHTADIVSCGSTSINIYKEGNRSCDPYALSRLNADCENRDGTAILQTAKRVKKISKAERVIMFVISDGEPCACGYYGKEAIRDVHDKVKKVEAMGFTVIQVTIDYVPHAPEMFTHYIDLRNNLANLPKLLGKEIKEAILKDRKTTIT